MKTIKAIISFFIELWKDAEKSAKRARLLQDDGLERIAELERKVNILLDRK